MKDLVEGRMCKRRYVLLIYDMYIVITIQMKKHTIISGVKINHELRKIL